jgi:sugar lactone lactonase YvrE
VSADPRGAEARVDVVSEGHAFLEGPRWHGGALYASDFFTRSVLRWDGDGSPTTVCEVEAQPSGLGWTPDGDLLVVSMVDRRLLRKTADGLAEVASLRDVAPWHCNDMVVDAAGRAYIGNFGWDESTDPRIVSTTVSRVDPDGTVRVVADDLVCPNGMALSPDGRTLFVNETFAARVTAFDVDDAGDLSGRRVWASFADREFATVTEALDSGVLLPDGMALDQEGAIWLADCHGHGATRVAAGGEVLERIETGDAVFALALGGDDLRTLYMCSTFPYGAGDPSTQHTGRMLRARVDVPGVPTR